MINTINSINIIAGAKQYNKPEILASEELRTIFNSDLFFSGRQTLILMFVDEINKEGGTLIIDHDKSHVYVTEVNIELIDRIENPGFYRDKPPYGKWNQSSI